MNRSYGVCRVFILMVLSSLTIILLSPKDKDALCLCVCVFWHTCLFCSPLKLSEDWLQRGSHSWNNAAEECRPEGRRPAVRFVQIVQRCQTVLTQGLVTWQSEHTDFMCKSCLIIICTCYQKTIIFDGIFAPKPF